MMFEKVLKVGGITGIVIVLLTMVVTSLFFQDLLGKWMPFFLLGIVLFSGMGSWGKYLASKKGTERTYYRYEYKIALIILIVVFILLLLFGISFKLGQEAAKKKRGIDEVACVISYYTSFVNS